LAAVVMMANRIARSIMTQEQRSVSVRQHNSEIGDARIGDGHTMEQPWCTWQWKNRLSVRALTDNITTRRNKAHPRGNYRVLPNRDRLERECPVRLRER